MESLRNFYVTGGVGMRNDLLAVRERNQLPV